MDRVFGAPAGDLALVLAVLMGIASLTVALLVLRHPVFCKMGMRNIPRRRARSALIVVGLMLATTILASALLTGDTMSRTVRGSVVDALGHTDETIVAGGRAEIEGGIAIDTAHTYFDMAPAVAAVEAATATSPVDGVMAAIIEPVAAQHPAEGRTEPRLTLFAPDEAQVTRFGLGDVRSLGDDEILLTDDAADELAAGPGDRIGILVGGEVATVTIRDVGSYRGGGTSGSGAVMRLATAQRLLGRPGQVNHILVSNDGGIVGGERHTDEVVATLDEAVSSLGLSAQPAKQDGLEEADATGNAFVQLFTTFGTFSMAAGVLLIFLIFVLLAAERRPEMGMARAVGTRRTNLVETFLFEGAIYDVAAAAVGALLGIAVSYLLVRVVAVSFDDLDLDLAYSMSGQSLVIAYGIGALLTLAVVTGSAWRVSRLNIISAIRDLPEEVTPRRGRRSTVTIALLVGLGLFSAVSGASGQTYLPWMVGVSLLTLALVPLLRMAGVSQRVAFTVSGLALVVLWLLPFSLFDALFGDMAMDFSVWIVGGLVIVIAATWVVTFNAELLLHPLTRLASPFARLRPVIRLAIAYPLRNRFRTGVTMAMFMLVVFTLVTGTVIPGSFVRAFDNVETFGGGFDIRVSLAPAAATDDVRPDLPAALADQIVVDASQSFVPVEARQADADRPFAAYPLRGVDDDFLSQTSYGFVAMAEGYRSSSEVWNALGADPSLAVVDWLVAPRRANWGFGALPDFQLSGFFVDGGRFSPVPVTVHDPATGDELELTVIGVLNDDAPFAMGGITVSQSALAGFGDRAPATVHHLTVDDDADATAVSRALESALLPRGAESETYREVLDDAVGESMLFIRLVQGFMGLGLIVGVAALGVVTARSVVERRQQLGMLRAIGFQPGMVRWTLMAETVFIAGTAIVVGTLLALGVSYNVIADSRRQPGWTDVAFVVPWPNLLGIFAAVLLAAMATTYLPARQASRLYPAEALRYR